MDRIGELLKSSYINADHVRRERKANGTKELIKQTTIERNHHQRTSCIYKITVCELDKAVGSLGTRGRECNSTLSEVKGSCDNLCCGEATVTAENCRGLHGFSQGINALRIASFNCRSRGFYFQRMRLEKCSVNLIFLLCKNTGLIN